MLPMVLGSIDDDIGKMAWFPDPSVIERFVIVTVPGP